MTGYSAEEMQKMQVWDFFVHKEEIQKLQQNAKQRLEGGAPPPLIEFSIRNKSGEIRHILGYVSYVTYENQPAIQGILLDITEKKELEKQLAEQARFFNAIYNATNNGLSVITPDFRIEMANSTAQKLYGKNLEGKHCYEVYQKRDSICPFCPTRRTFETGLPQSELVPYPSEKNPVGYILLNTYPLRDENGRVIRVIENYQDVTEQKKLEEKLIQAQKMESVGILAAGIAHDFNNLLGGILGYASLLQIDENLSSEAKEMVHAISETAQRASNLTKQLLGFARKGKYENKPISINRVLEETYDIILHRLQKKISIKKNYTSPLPAVMGDASQFQQVILNICLNAIDAMPEGGTLTLYSEIVENTHQFRKRFPGPTAPLYVHIGIRDTGTGMDQQTISKIFDPFFTTKEPGKGTGLGLSMVYGIVKNHNGFLDVESKVGKGTTFHIYLPAVPETIEKEIQATPQTIPSQLKGNILIVDDEEVIRKVLVRMLKRMGFSVTAASNGQEAIHIFQESDENFDLVIIDMLMPIMDGKETFSVLKSLDPNVRVLLSTGYSMDSSAQELMNAGVLGYLHKPFNIHELSQKVSSVLSHSMKNLQKQPATQKV
jgi:PAS domain S-box-containing protein